jgi:hypothetical protein
MSAVGFAPSPSEDPELDRLREVCQRLNFTIKAIQDAQASLTQLNIGQARRRLKNGLWQAEEAKKLLVKRKRPGRRQRSGVPGLERSYFYLSVQ